MLRLFTIIMFVSKVKIFVKAGNGGRGAISFRREKFVPFGGPNGGNGGRGGHIIFMADKSINTLSYFKYHRHFFAKHGENGTGSDCNGKNGEDFIIKVPVGTAIFNKEEILIGDLNKNKQELILFPGGKGGIGNGGMATSTDRAPRISIPPTTCEMQELKLILTLKTDVGILGAPNAGKSSLINVLSRANSMVGDYEFTTINPVLGQMYNTNISLMDLPGIIEGAYLGKGRGLEFLRHSEQCKIFIHLVDISKNPPKAYEMILEELNRYGHMLIHIPSIIVLNKIDLLSKAEVLKIQKDFPNSIAISTVTGEGIDLLEEKLKEFFPPEILETKPPEVKESKISIGYYEENDEIPWGPYYDFLKIIGERILQHKNEERGFSVLLTNYESMITLNETHRGKPQDTNVISLELEGNPYFLGEIILSFSKIAEEYERLKEHYESFEKYLCFIYIHGILHLFAYDHLEEQEALIMEEQEKFYMQLLQKEKMLN